MTGGRKTELLSYRMDVLPQMIVIFDRWRVERCVLKRECSRCSVIVVE